MWVLVQVGGLSHIAPVGQEESGCSPTPAVGHAKGCCSGRDGTHCVKPLGENGGGVEIHPKQRCRLAIGIFKRMERFPEYVVAISLGRERKFE